MEPKSGNDEDAKIGNGYATATTTATDDNKPVNDFSGELVPAVDSPSDVAAANGTCRSSRTPFTNLSQVDADLALARTLQEQERAYMMLSTGGNGVAYRGWADYGFSYDEDQDDDDDDDDDDVDDFDPHSEDYIGTDAEVEEEDYAVGDVHALAHEEDDDEDVEYDVENDEEYARAIQDIEDQDVAARLLSLAGLNDEVVEDIDEQDDDDDDNNAQGMWDDEVDPDELSYEELLALGEVVGTESRGLSADVIASLPSFSYKTAKNADASCDPCVICRLEYEEDDTLTLLSCKHSYHSECINNWLNINKICPVCSTEVSTSSK